MRVFSALVLLAGVWCVDESLLDDVVPLQKPQGSFEALAKAKAKIGQPSGLGNDAVPIPTPGVALVDHFALVVSEQRGGEDRASLVARSEFQKLIHYNHFASDDRARLNDKKYVSAWREALRKAIKPGHIVLCNRVMTGLLPMLAVRFGAAHVYAVEGNPVYYDIARTIIHKNGLSDKIKLIHKNFTELNSEDIPFKVDVFVNEHVVRTAIASMMGWEASTARQFYLKEDGVMIPQLASLGMFGVECDYLRKGMRVTGPVTYFNFSRLNLLAPTNQAKAGNINQYYFRSLSARWNQGSQDMQQVWMVKFDTMEYQPLPQYFQIEHQVVSSGILDALVFYLDMWLDGTSKLSTNPEHGAQNHPWLGQTIVDLTPRHVKANDTLTVLVGIHVDYLCADIIKINGQPADIPFIPTSSQAI